MARRGERGGYPWEIRFKEGFEVVTIERDRDGMKTVLS